MKLATKIKVQYLLYLLPVTIPLFAFPFLNFKRRAITWDWVVITGLIYLFFMLGATGKKVRIPRDQVLFLLLVFNFFLILSGIRPLFMGDENQIINFLSAWPQYILFSLGFVVVSSLRYKESAVRTLLKVYLMVAWAVAVFGIIQVLAFWFFKINLYPKLSYVMYTRSESGYEMYLGGLKRAASIFEEPRQFGVFLDVAFFTALMSFWWQPPLFKSRWIKRIVIVTFAAGIFLSLSTSSYLEFFMMMILTSVFFGKRWPFKIVVTIFGVCAGGLAFGFLLNEFFGVSLVGYLSNRLHTVAHLPEVLRFDTEMGGMARYIRGTIAALKTGFENPFLGVGLNQSHIWLKPYENLGLVVMPPFDLLASIGIPGSISFAFFLLALTKKGRRLRNKSNEYVRSKIDTALGLIGVAVIATFAASGYQFNTSQFWFLLYVAALIIYNTPLWSQVPKATRIVMDNNGRKECFNFVPCPANYSKSNESD